MCVFCHSESYIIIYFTRNSLFLFWQFEKSRRNLPVIHSDTFPSYFNIISSYSLHRFCSVSTFPSLRYFHFHSRLFVRQPIHFFINLSFILHLTITFHHSFLLFIPLHFQAINPVTSNWHYLVYYHHCCSLVYNNDPLLYPPSLNFMAEASTATIATPLFFWRFV